MTEPTEGGHLVLQPNPGWLAQVADSDVSANAFAVASALTLYWSQRATVTTATIAALMRDTKLARNTVRNALDLLMMAGLLEVKRTGRGRTTKTTYTAITPERRAAQRMGQQLTHSEAPEAENGSTADPFPGHLVQQVPSVRVSSSSEESSANAPDSCAMGQQLTHSLPETEHEPPPEAPRARQRDLIFEALADAVAVALEDIPRGAASRGQWNGARASLVQDNATPELIRAAGEIWRSRYPDRSYWTPMAIAKHYPQLVGEIKINSPEEQRRRMAKLAAEIEGGRDDA